MLPQAITITTSSGGPGVYTCNIVFSDSSKAKYLRIGDTVEDRLGNQYEVDSWDSFPSDFSNNGSVTLSFITNDVAPATFSSFGDGLVFTDGQVDVRPAVRTVGQILSQTVQSGQNFTYSITCAWGDTSEAQKSQAGDKVVDINGKEYSIVSKNDTDFTGGIIQETILEGIPPAGGVSTLYRATSTYGFFQGTELNNEARTIIRNRDNYSFDSILSQAGSSSGDAVKKELTNDSGVPITKGTPVKSDSANKISAIDVSSESEALAVIGIAEEDIANGSSGIIVVGGLLEDISTTAGVQELVYIDKSGNLTNIKPDIGVNGFVAGDLVISMGVITQNQDNPSLKDISVNIQTVGQL